ncbi:MAG: hypothetical protein ACK53Y_18350, partial [bacterium]
EWACSRGASLIDLAIQKPTIWMLSNNNSPYFGQFNLHLIVSANSGNKCTQRCKQFPCKIPSALLSSKWMVFW